MNVGCSYTETNKIVTWEWKLKREVRCECNNHATLKVSKSAFSPGRPFFACRNKGGCRFLQWADVAFTRKTEELQKISKSIEGSKQKKRTNICFL